MEPTLLPEMTLGSSPFSKSALTTPCTTALANLAAHVALHTKECAEFTFTFESRHPHSCPSVRMIAV